MRTFPLMIFPGAAYTMAAPGDQRTGGHGVKRPIIFCPAGAESPGVFAGG